MQFPLLVIFVTLLCTVLISVQSISHSGHDYQLIIQGSFEAEAEAIIALDDIKLSRDLCPGLPSPTPDPCAVMCDYSGECIPSNKVCDFFPDCAQWNKDDDTDERDCDSCDFEKSTCKWKDVSGEGSFRWNRTQGHPKDNSTGPDVDHTKGMLRFIYFYSCKQVTRKE